MVLIETVMVTMEKWRDFNSSVYMIKECCLLTRLAMTIVSNLSGLSSVPSTNCKPGVGLDVVESEQ